MKVSVYKGEQGDLTVLVQASPGRGLAPVLVRDITLANIQEKVLPVVDAMRRAKPLSQETPAGV